MRDEKEERKKQARSNKQTRQGNTAHTTCICTKLGKLNIRHTHNKYIHVHVYAHMYVYVCMYVHVYMHVCMYVCTCMHVCTYVRMSTNND